MKLQKANRLYHITGVGINIDKCGGDRVNFDTKIKAPTTEDAILKLKKEYVNITYIENINIRMIKYFADL